MGGRPRSTLIHDTADMFDVIEAIHACYAPIRRDADWIDGVLATLAKIASGLGAWGIAFTPCAGGGRFELLAQRGDLPDVAEMTAPMNPLLDEVTHRALLQPYPAVELFSKRARRWVGWERSWLRPAPTQRSAVGGEASRVRPRAPSWSDRPRYRRGSTSPCL